MHQGSSMHNQGVFGANVFFPYKRKVWGMASYGENSFMRFIPRGKFFYEIYTKRP